MNQDELILKALRNRGCNHSVRVTEYKGFRPGQPDILLELKDSGQADGMRFNITIRDNTGRVAGGYPAPTVEQALTTVQWAKLDVLGTEDEEDTSK